MPSDAITVRQYVRTRAAVPTASVNAQRVFAVFAVPRTIAYVRSQLSDLRNRDIAAAIYWLSLRKFIKRHSLGATIPRVAPPTLPRMQRPNAKQGLPLAPRVPYVVTVTEGRKQRTLTGTLTLLKPRPKPNDQEGTP